MMVSEKYSAFSSLIGCWPMAERALRHCTELGFRPVWCDGCFPRLVPLVFGACGGSPGCDFLGLRLAAKVSLRGSSG